MSSPAASLTAESDCQPVLIAGRWRAAGGDEVFQATDPSRNQPIARRFPVSGWSDVDEALTAAAAAAQQLRRLPAEKLAEFLETYADLIQANGPSLAEVAQQETALPVKPRLLDVELPRTFNQLRTAAAAARQGSWALPVIDTRGGLRSCYRPLGPVCVMGPNNFPFAFNGISGGDFAAAIAAGNPVIAKANSSHPETSRQLAILADQAVRTVGLPAATVQLIYRISHTDGERLVADPRCAAVGYTGSRGAGLKLKAAADASGTPIYLELSSVNPVVFTPQVLRERVDKLIEEFVGSVLMGTGQFCTNPGLILLVRSPAAEQFVAAVGERFAAATPGTLLSPAVNQSLGQSIETLVAAGAQLVSGGGQPLTDRCARPNTWLSATGDQFLAAPEKFQTEAFGNASLAVVANDVEQVIQIIGTLEGNLTGCIYSSGDDDPDYAPLAFALEPKVGRLLNDKMPTGVAVSPAMNHGGPYPATGHPGFTAVGIPASLIRFAKLTCFDHVDDARLPSLLQNRNPTGETWRSIDGRWTTEDVTPH